MNKEKFFKADNGYKININYNKQVNIVVENIFFHKFWLICLSKKVAREMAKEILRTTTEKDKNLIFGDKK